MTVHHLAETELIEWAREWGVSLPPHAVVWLSGDLGTGKTTVARAILEGLGVETEATSPTYELVHRHSTPERVLYHLDCYRLQSPSEAAELDWETIRRGDLTLIEWPERAGPWALSPTVRVRLAHLPDSTRRAVEILP